jgi:hypothetical protein
MKEFTKHDLELLKQFQTVLYPDNPYVEAGSYEELINLLISLYHRVPDGISFEVSCHDLTREVRVTMFIPDKDSGDVSTLSLPFPDFKKLMLRLIELGDEASASQEEY